MLDVLEERQSHTLLQGDTRQVLRTLPEASVQCVVTSPPYWGLRDYSRCDCNSEYQRRGEEHPLPEKQGGTVLQRTPDPSCPKCHGTGKDDSLNVVWGGEDCEHEWGEEIPPRPGRGNKPGGKSSSLTNPERQDTVPRPETSGAFCSLCHAWRGQLGLEPTPDLYVQHVVEVFREVRRVLRDDGTLWLNMGDCYAGTGTRDQEAKPPGVPSGWVNQSGGYPATKATGGLKPKDLVGMPWRVAFALQADGWWLRSDIIWAKPNPMPESVTDRPTRSHEYLFLLTNSGRTQYWTHRARTGTRILPGPDYIWRHRKTQEERTIPPAEWLAWWDRPAPRGANPSSWSRINLWEGHDYFYDADAVREATQSGPSDIRKMIERKDRLGGKTLTATDPRYKANLTTNIGRKRSVGDPLGRNRRTVWEIATQPYPEAHFATFPEKLVEPCIKAGTPEKGSCSVCGSPWGRVVETEYVKSPIHGSGSIVGSRGIDRTESHLDAGAVNKESFGGLPRVNKSVRTTGFRPTCDHDPATPTPALVLDPFCGSGTAGLVAIGNGRRFLGIDIKAEYLSMAEKRLRRFPVRLDGFQ